MFAIIRNFVRNRHLSATRIQNSMYRTSVAYKAVQRLRDAKGRKAAWQQHMRNEYNGQFARRIQSIFRQRSANKYVKHK